ncbi:MAG: DJ-1/PfpI family protein [Rhodocyclaceae bacterium]|nr:DJ-1/PfpI family protein [Rhodocyclaceae bacterium]
MTTRQVGIYVYPGVEVLDFAGPFEVFTTASRVAARRAAAEPPFRVLTLAREPGPVTARAGFRHLPDALIGDHPPLDLLVVPGGDERNERDEPALMAWLQRTAPGLEVLASVCTGAFLLAGASLLDGRRVTTHWEDVAELARLYPALAVADTGRWIDDGDVVTSAGISAGLDMALHLVARSAGEELAMATARQMDYHWQSRP